MQHSSNVVVIAGVVCKIKDRRTHHQTDSKQASKQGMSLRSLADAPDKLQVLVALWLTFETVSGALRCDQEPPAVSSDLKKSLRMAVDDRELRTSSRCLAAGSLIILEDVRGQRAQAEDKLLSPLLESLEQEDDWILQNRTVDVLVEAATRKLLRSEDTGKICEFIMLDKSFTAR
eukprot:754578-Hanusia_phi.AAC.5